QGLTHLSAEAAVGERMRITGDVLTIEPSRAGRGDLPINVVIRSHRECRATLAIGVVEFAQLDDRAGCAIPSGIEVGKLDVMGASVNTIDHGIGGALQLVIEAAGDEPP